MVSTLKEMSQVRCMFQVMNNWLVFFSVGIRGGLAYGLLYLQTMFDGKQMFRTVWANSMNFRLTVDVAVIFQSRLASIKRCARAESIKLPALTLP